MTTFDEDTKLKLIGMRAVSMDLWKQIDAFREAANRLVGLPSDDYGHISDFLSGDTTVDELQARIPATESEAR